MNLTAIRLKIQEQIDANLYLGACLAIYDKGAWQVMTLGSHTPEEPVKADAVYDVASVSKVMGVGTIMAFLLKEGLIDLDRTLYSYYSGIEDKTVTLRQLATHTSGVDPYIPNRDSLDADGLRQAINHIRFDADKTFRYSDVNLILLGFWLEEYFGKSLDQLFSQQIWQPWQMTQTSFGPRPEAVPTINGVFGGEVHDPKAKVLKGSCASAGLFTTLGDLQLFLEHYLKDDFARDLWQNMAEGDKSRSLVWNLDGAWLDHTGYTGPFVMVNRSEQQAVIFLTNRTYAYDDRPLWIAKRRELRDIIKETLSNN